MKEVWMFANWKPLDATAKNSILACKATDVVLGVVIGGDNGELKVAIDRTKLVVSALWLKENNIRIHLMYWVVNNTKFIDNLIYTISSDLDACKTAKIPIASVMYDAEKDWHNGGSSARSKCVDLLQAYHTAQYDMKFGVTGLARLHRTVEPLLQICHYGLPQAYAVWFPPSAGAEDHWSHSPNTEPNAIINIAHNSWRVFDKPLVMGLANYWLARPAAFDNPKMTEMQNLHICIDECEQRGYSAVAYWSVNHAKRAMIKEFIASLSTPQNPSIANSHPIEAVQWLLVKLGYDLGDSGPNHDGVDGVWGTKSQNALASFRTHRGFVIVGPVTIEDLCEMILVYRDIV